MRIDIVPLQYMSAIKKLLFINVVIVLLLHALIPHKHHGEMTHDQDITTHIPVDGFINHIGLAFHQGSCNSENFILSEKSFQKKVDINLTGLFERTYFLKDKLKQIPFLIFQSHKLLYRFHIFSNGLRGPPGNDYYR